MPHRRFSFILLLLFAIAAPSARGQAGGGLSEEAVISLLTILPGDEIHALWGHSAIRVHDPARGLDVSFNYGTFQFDAYFLPKFLYGELDYELSVHDYALALESYREARRPVIEQLLTLSAAQKDSLFRFLRLNARPENRVYRYHFIYDNCSTRIRDALEQSLGSDVSYADVPDPGLTFRRLLDSGLRGRPLLDAGIDWLFGPGVDRVAQPYETMFLPLYLRDAFDHTSILIDGAWMPLVARTDTVFWVPGHNGSGRPLPWAVVAAWLVFAIGAVLTLRGLRTDTVVYRWFDAPLFILIGVAGVLIAFLWFVSLHDVTEENWHLLWCWPTHVIAAVALWRRSSKPWVPAYLLAAAVTALTVAALGPSLEQWIHPALYPLMLVTTVRGGWIFAAERRLPIHQPSIPKS